MMFRIAPRVLALLLLTASLTTTSASAIGTHTCPDGQSKWVFRSGTAPFVDDCYSNSFDLANAYAEAQCLAAWDGFASDIATSGTYTAVAKSHFSGGLTYWSFSCYTCIDGYLPAFQTFEPAISLNDAGGIGGVLVGGVAESVRLVREVSQGTPFYEVLVATSQGSKLVLVDALTGEARDAEDEGSSTCQR